MVILSMKELHGLLRTYNLLCYGFVRRRCMGVWRPLNNIRYSSTGCIFLDVFLRLVDYNTRPDERTYSLCVPFTYCYDVRGKSHIIIIILPTHTIIKKDKIIQVMRGLALLMSRRRFEECCINIIKWMLKRSSSSIRPPVITYIITLRGAVARAPQGTKYFIR